MTTIRANCNPRPMPLRPQAPPREALVAEHAAGKTFADVGCMWQVHGALAFAAEDAGATRGQRHGRHGPDAASTRPSTRAAGRGVRFVQGDLHDEDAVERLGAHDVVWCSGVIYHAPHPLLTLERLRALTTDTLILATEVIREVRGHPRACVFAPDPGATPPTPSRSTPPAATSTGSGV